MCGQVPGALRLTGLRTGLNGVYVRTGPEVNGAAVFKKAPLAWEQPPADNMWLFLGSDGDWWISDEQDKDDGTDEGWACAMGGVPWESNTEWSEITRDGEWELAGAVRVESFASEAEATARLAREPWPVGQFTSAEEVLGAAACRAAVCPCGKVMYSQGDLDFKCNQRRVRCEYRESAQ